MLKELTGKGVLITGGAGQIGSRLIEKLINYNADIKILDIHLPQSRVIKKLIDSDQIKFIQCDLTKMDNLESIKGYLEEIDHVIHLASIMTNTTDIINDAIINVNLNIIGTINLLKVIPESTKSLCYSSTMIVYGIPVYIPVDENHPTNPTNIYGACKLATEKFLRIFSRENCVPVTILRYSSVYGPGKLTKRAIPSFIKSVAEGIPPTIYGDGSVMRDYVYIDDVVDATILALIKKRSRVYNIGMGEGHSIREVAEIIIELFGKNFKPRDVATNEKQMSFVYDISTARKDLGYSPKIYLREGLKRTIDYITAYTKI